MAEIKKGLLFPGQGSQVIGMGAQLYELSAAARWVFDKANEVLGRDIKKLCFEGPEDALQTTANSQPAIFTTSIATLNVLVEKIKRSPVGDEEREIFSADDISEAPPIIALYNVSSAEACFIESINLPYLSLSSLCIETAAKLLIKNQESPR